MTLKTLLVLGGARSGKSRYAQGRAEEPGMCPIYLATAQAFDGEMLDRIAQHQAERDSRWQTVEAPIDLSGAILLNSRADTVILVDCLTLWTSNLLLGGHDIGKSGDMLVDALRAATGIVILVSNEVGSGIVPDNLLARQFRDAAGQLNQKIAAAVDEVQFVVAGLPLRLK